MQDQEQVTHEDININFNKGVTKADRMLRSDAARARRKELKQIREMKIVNEWAKARRERKAK